MEATMSIQNNPFDRLIVGGANSNFSLDDPIKPKNKTLPLSQRVVVVARKSIPQNKLASSKPLTDSHKVIQRSRSKSSSGSSSNDITPETQPVKK